MKKKFTNPFFRIILTCIPIGLLTLTAMYSCKSSSSVRDIKASRGETVTSSSFSYSSKVPGEAMVKPLFMQSKRANIELPFQEKSKLGAGSATVSEEVTYINPEKIIDETQSNRPSNLSDVQQLSEVVITAKSRFTPERNGRVNVDFMLRVPRELLSDNWRITLSPILFHNDSIIPLKDVILKGSAFYAQQKQDYKE